MEDQSLCSQFKLTERSKPSPLEICEDIHWQEITPVAMIITTAAILKRIEEARASGARELVGGPPQRWVLPPHVFADLANDHPLAREELFGPVAPLIRAKGEAHALHLANDTPYGLSSAVFTGDIERGCVSPSVSKRG